jgi:4-amino-4-deoxy-L-arabinose transferase-like glycosyltransferase
MKNIGIAAIVAGIVVIILGLAGIIGQTGNFRTVMVGAVVLLVVGFLLYRRGQRDRAV